MDRTIKRNSGFTFIEMMIVLVMVVVLSGIAISGLRHLTSVNSINEDMHKISSFIHDQKLFAFTQKQTVYLFAVGTQLTTIYDPSGDDTLGPPVVDPSGDDVAGPTLTLNNTIRASAAVFTATTRGNITNGNISINAINTGAQYSCVQLDNIRIRLGAWNGAACTPL